MHWLVPHITAVRELGLLCGVAVLRLCVCKCECKRKCKREYECECECV